MSIYEKVKQHWGWVEKSVAYKKSVYFVRLVFSRFFDICGNLGNVSRREFRVAFAWMVKK